VPIHTHAGEPARTLCGCHLRANEGYLTRRAPAAFPTIDSGLPRTLPPRVAARRNLRAWSGRALPSCSDSPGSSRSCLAGSFKLTWLRCVSPLVSPVQAGFAISSLRLCLLPPVRMHPLRNAPRCPVGLAGPRPDPAGSCAPFVPPFSVFLLADPWVGPPESPAPCWLTVATVYPLGNCDSPRARNRPGLLDSAQGGFLSPLAAQLLFAY
jgi:hypothetical protein